MIPKPLSRIGIVLRPLEDVPSVADESGFEAERARVENLVQANQAA